MTKPLQRQRRRGLASDLFGGLGHFGSFVNVIIGVHGWVVVMLVYGCEFHQTFQSQQKPAKIFIRLILARWAEIGCIVPYSRAPGMDR